jgi:hypothetical protein
VIVRKELNVVVVVLAELVMNSDSFLLELAKALE